MEIDLVLQTVEGPAQELAKQLNRSTEAILVKAQKLQPKPPRRRL